MKLKVEIATEYFKEHDKSMHGSHPTFPDQFRSMASDYHDSGFKWPESKMQAYFRLGLLSYLVFSKTGINLNVPNDDRLYYTDSGLGIRNTIGSARMFLRDTCLFGFYNMQAAMNSRGASYACDRPYFRSIVRPLTTMLQTNPILNFIGGEYLRLRSIQEHLEPLMSDKGLTDQEQALYEKTSQDGINLFVIMLNWIDHFKVELHDFAKSYNSLDEIAANKHKFNPALLPESIRSDLKDIYDEETIDKLLRLESLLPDSIPSDDTDSRVNPLDDYPDDPALIHTTFKACCEDTFFTRLEGKQSLAPDSVVVERSRPSI